MKTGLYKVWNQVEENNSARTSRDGDFIVILLYKTKSDRHLNTSRMRCD